MKSFALLDSSEAEEIIKLRVELAKAKAKLVRYEDYLIKVDRLGSISERLSHQFNTRQIYFNQICKMTGLQMQPMKITNAEASSKINQDRGQHIQQMIFRYQELFKNQEVEETVLKSFSQQIADIIKQHKSLKDAQRQLQKQHSGCGVKLSILDKLAQHSRVLELTMKQKETELSQMAKSKESLQEEIDRSTRRCEQLQTRLNQLQTEIEEKNRLVAAQQQRQSEGEAILSERQQVLDRCNSLMEMLQIRDQEYLSHYFRSNGLPLQVQRTYKSKYQMVFDL